jgi:hypothetical protein
MNYANLLGETRLLEAVGHYVAPEYSSPEFAVLATTSLENYRETYGREAVQLAILRDIAHRACFGDAKAAEVLSPYLGLFSKAKGEV